MINTHTHKQMVALFFDPLKELHLSIRFGDARFNTNNIISFLFYDIADGCSCWGEKWIHYTHIFKFLFLTHAYLTGNRDFCVFVSHVSVTMCVCVTQLFVTHTFAHSGHYFFSPFFYLHSFKKKNKKILQYICVFSKSRTIHDNSPLYLCKCVSVICCITYDMCILTIHSKLYPIEIFV